MLNDVMQKGLTDLMSDMVHAFLMHAEGQEVKQTGLDVSVNVNVTRVVIPNQTPYTVVNAVFGERHALYPYVDNVSLVIPETTLATPCLLFWPRHKTIERVHVYAVHLLKGEINFTWNYAQ